MVDFKGSDELPHARHAQQLLGALAAFCGTPFAEDKHQEMSSIADFLGVEHNLSDLATTGVIPVRPRQQLVEGTLELLAYALQIDWLTPGEARVLCGKLQFIAAAVFNRVGRV